MEKKKKGGNAEGITNVLGRAVKIEPLINPPNLKLLLGRRRKHMALSNNDFLYLVHTIK